MTEFTMESLKADRLNVLSQNVPDDMGFRLKRMACRLTWELLVEASIDYDEAENDDVLVADKVIISKMDLAWRQWRLCDYQLCDGPVWHQWFFRYNRRR